MSLSPHLEHHRFLYGARTRGDHGSTFRGNVLTTAAAYAGSKYLIDHYIPAHVKRMEVHLLSHLRTLHERFPTMHEVRGKGLLAAIEFTSDLAGAVLTQANAAGVLLNAVRPNTVRLMPPLIISATEIDEAMSRLETALTRLP